MNIEMKEDMGPGKGNNSKVLISIIMPSLNVAPYIQKCIESVLAQTLENIEIICIDAGSTDGTAEILGKYAAMDSRIRFIQTDKKSYGYQVNLGISQAHGEYIGIVETDDYIERNMYEILYSYTIDNRPDYVKGGYIPFAECKNLEYCCPIERSYLNGIWGKCINLNAERARGLLDLNHIWTGIYRKAFLLKNAIKLHESPGASYQDVSFSLLVGLLAETGIYIQDSCYHYRLDNANSSVKSCEKWECIIEEFRYLDRELIKRKYDPQIRAAVQREKIGDYYWNAMRLPLKERKLFLAKIKQEFCQYEISQSFNRDLDDAHRELLKLLNNPDALEKSIMEREKVFREFESFIIQILSGKRFVLICAGRIGKCILQIQEILGDRFIVAAADNSVDRQGSQWEQFFLLSVCEAVKQYGKHCFVVANKRNTEELREQLMNLGVPADRIFSFAASIHIEDMIQLIANQLVKRE